MTLYLGKIKRIAEITLPLKPDYQEGVRKWHYRDITYKKGMTNGDCGKQGPIVVRCSKPIRRQSRY
jgi:hypothetical protein